MDWKGSGLAMSVIWSFVKWCYRRWGQALCFVVAATITAFALDSVTEPGLGESFLAIGWLAAGLVLRGQMIAKEKK